MQSNRWSAVLLSLGFLAACAGAQNVALTTVTPPVLGFVDISASGTPIPNMFDDAEAAIQTTIGNSVFPAGNVLVSNNGVAISGVASGNVPFDNVALSPSTLPSGFPVLGSAYLFPFWDDLQPLANAEDMTVYWRESAGVLTIMWKDEGTFPVVAGQIITFEIQVFTNPGCGPSVQFLYPDTTFGGTQISHNSGLSATIGYVGAGPLNFGTLQHGFDMSVVPAGTTVTIFDPATTVSASSPVGPGSLYVSYSASSCSAVPPVWVLAVTTHAGNWPAGWLFGVDIPIYELLAEMTFGYPHVGMSDGFSLGPFTGLPPVTLYGVVLGFSAPIGAGTLVSHSNAFSHAIP
jgi:hypothetical protein